MEKERDVPCSPKTLARRITSVKSFYRWLTKFGVLHVDQPRDDDVALRVELDVHGAWLLPSSSATSVPLRTLPTRSRGSRVAPASAT